MKPKLLAVLTMLAVCVTLITYGFYKYTQVDATTLPRAGGVIVFLNELLPPPYHPPPLVPPPLQVPRERDYRPSSIVAAVILRGSVSTSSPCPDSGRTCALPMGLGGIGSNSSLNSSSDMIVLTRTSLLFFVESSAELPQLADPQKTTEWLSSTKR